MVGDLNIRIAKLAFHAKESPFRTRDEVFYLVSSYPNSPAYAYSPMSRTPYSGTPSVAPEPGFNDGESGAQIVFGIARRVYSPNNPK